MLGFLEAKIAAAACEGLEWMPLVGLSLVGAGCLRYRRVSISTPRKITKSSFHALCCQGKQPQNREGFYWRASSTFTTGFSWVEGWLESYSKLWEEKNVGL